MTETRSHPKPPLRALDQRLPRTLADLEPGERGLVQELVGDTNLRRRLLELGSLPGSWVRLVRAAPLGCPLEIEIEATRWSVRRETARAVRLAARG